LFGFLAVAVLFLGPKKQFHVTGKNGNSLNRQIEVFKLIRVIKQTILEIF
jgi:hypothetical protein